MSTSQGSVWGGAIGCVLLLLKNRLAFPVLLASLIGTSVSSLGGLLFLGGIAVMRETGGLGLTMVPLSSPHSSRLTLVR